MRNALGRFFNSPVLTVAVVIAFGFIGFKIYGIVKPMPAPTLQGWDWKDHKKSVLFYYAPGCNCSTSDDVNVGKYLKSGFQIVLVTDEKEQKVRQRFRKFSKANMVLFFGVPKPEMLRLNPARASQFFVVENGILRRDK